MVGSSVLLVIVLAAEPSPQPQPQLPPAPQPPVVVTSVESASLTAPPDLSLSARFGGTVGVDAFAGISPHGTGLWLDAAGSFGPLIWLPRRPSSGAAFLAPGLDVSIGASTSGHARLLLGLELGAGVGYERYPGDARLDTGFTLIVSPLLATDLSGVDLAWGWRAALRIRLGASSGRSSGFGMPIFSALPLWAYVVLIPVIVLSPICNLVEIGAEELYPDHTHDFSFSVRFGWQF
jgi:hypothetical protein